MANDAAIQLMNQGLWLVLALSAPPVLAACLASLIVAILQAATQIQEQTTQYVVKFLAVVVTLAIFGQSVGGAIYAFSDRIFSDFASLVRP